ncbi:MAG: MOSC domain-containing protein, partial [Actinomycetota bacterium]
RASHPRLATLDTRFDPGSNILAIHRNGRRVVAADPGNAAGRAVLSEFFAAFLGAGPSGRPQLVEEAEAAFLDQPRPLISLVGTGSLAEVERLARRPIGLEQLRTNLLVAGLPPWRELGWVGAHLRVGNAVLRVVEVLVRHRPLADPVTGRVDMVVPLKLAAAFGHRCLGVLAEVVEGEEVELGDVVEPA